MDKTTRKLRIVTLDREKCAREFLISEAGWDGKFPIPVAYFGAMKIKDLNEEMLNLVHVSGDDQAIWVGDAVSASILYLKGHDLVKNPDILAKRSTFKKDKKKKN